MSMPVCPVCDGSNVETIFSSLGKRAYCLTCYHGWRIDLTSFTYDSWAMCSLGTSRERLLEQVAFIAPFCRANAAILEIGCATGELAATVRELLSPARYEAIELSPAGLTAVQYLDEMHTNPLVELLDRGAISTNFDMVLMSHVLEHLDDPRAEIRAMKAVSSPRGAMFVEVPNGAGHRKLPIDDNRSHLHFFSATSLTRLLASEGLEVIASATGARLDARYADSLRVIARPFSLPEIDRDLLSRSPLLGDERVVIWGAGTLTDEVIANFFDLERVDFFVDRNPAKLGVPLLGRPVLGPEALGEEARLILVNSIDFAPAILADIQAMFPGVAHRVVPIADILENLP